jgi:hypothetical protein
MIIFFSSRTPAKDVQVPGEASSPAESTSNIKFLHFFPVLGINFGLPGSGFN